MQQSNSGMIYTAVRVHVCSLGSASSAGLSTDTPGTQPLFNQNKSKTAARSNVSNLYPYDTAADQP